MGVKFWRFVPRSLIVATMVALAVGLIGHHMLYASFGCLAYSLMYLLSMMKLPHDTWSVETWKGFMNSGTAIFGTAQKGMGAQQKNAA